MTLPASLSRIKSGVFTGCTGLTEITCLAVAPPPLSSASAFSSFPVGFVIKVPRDSVDAYKTAPPLVCPRKQDSRYRGLTTSPVRGV